MTIEYDNQINTLIVSNDENYLEIVKNGLNRLNPELEVETTTETDKSLSLLTEPLKYQIIISESIIGEAENLKIIE